MQIKEKMKTKIEFISSKQAAFSMMEIMLGLTILVLAFIPIYRMFSYGSKGTASTLSETMATAYASDLMSLVRELSYHEIVACMASSGEGNQDSLELVDDQAIKDFFKSGLEYYQQLFQSDGDIKIEEVLQKMSFTVPPMLIGKPESQESEAELAATEFKRSMLIKLFDDVDDKVKGVEVQGNDKTDQYTALTFIKTACIEVKVEYERSKGGPKADVTLITMVHDYL